MIHATTLRRSGTQISTSHDLFSGVCSSTEAKGFTEGLLASAANSYKLRNLSSLVHTECDDPEASRCSGDLVTAKNEIKTVLDEARSAGQKVRVTTHIQVEILDDEFTR